MPQQSIDLTLQPPIGGMVRSTAYQTQPPFTAFASLNMWPLDMLSGRLGVMATRPSFQQVTSPTGPVTLLSPINGFATGKPYESFIGGFNSDVYYWNGTGFTAATGAQASDIPTNRAVFGKAFLEKVYIGQDTGKPLVFDYDAGTVLTIVETAGTAPSDARIVEVWQGAVWLAGIQANPHHLYASRTGNAEDWDYTVSIDDEGGAFFSGAGNNNGLLNGPITAVMPHNDDTMIVSTMSGWMAMRAHPRRGGIFVPIDGTQYVLGQGAWCKAPGDILYALTPLGIVSLQPGVNAIPTQLSREKIPEELLSLTYDFADPKVSMIYDARWDGIQIFVRGAEEQAWFYHIQTGGFFRMETIGYPFVVMEYKPFITEQTNGLLYGGSILRDMDKYGDEQIESGVTIGPVKISKNSLEKSRVNEARIVLGRDTPTDPCSITVCVGTDGQDAINRMEIGEAQYTESLDVIRDNHGKFFPQVSGHAMAIAINMPEGNISFEEITVSLQSCGYNNLSRTDQQAIDGDPIDFTDPGDEFDDEEWIGYSEATPNTPNCTLPDHTLFIDLSRLPDSWWDVCTEPLGGEIRATDNVNDQIPIDVIYFDLDARTGFATVKITQQDPPTPVRLWTGNPDVGPEAPDSAFGQYNAYDSFWAAFWPSGGARDGGEEDRTANENHITLVNQVDETNLTDGPIGVEATDYVFQDATNNYGRATAVVPGTYPITLIVVARDTDNTTLPCLGARDQSGPTTANLELTANRTATLQSADAGSTNTAAGASEASSATVANAAVYRHFAATITSDVLRDAYIDGNNPGTDTTSIVIASGVLDELIIGKGARSGLSASSTTADLALAQAHSTARSACWINYQEQMLDQVDFWDDWSDLVIVNPPDDDEESPVEVGSWSGYAHATPINPAETRASWVHWIDLSTMPAQWWSAVSSSGVDIRATNQANRFLAFDLIEFDSVAMTGFATVKQTQSSVQAQPVRLWVGNASAVTVTANQRYGQYAVYDDGYKGFWPSGAGNDRTRNVNHITLHGGGTAGGVAGPIGNTATNYDGATQYGKVVPTVVGRIPPNEPLLLVAVAKPTNITQKMCSVSLNRQVFFGHSSIVHEPSSTPVRWEVRADSITAIAPADVVVSPGTWVHEVGWSIDNRRRGCLAQGEGPDAAPTTNIATHDYTRLTIGARISGDETAPVIYWPFLGDIALVQAHNTIRALDNSWADYQYEMLDQTTFWQTATWTWVAEINSLPQ